MDTTLIRRIVAALGLVGTAWAAVFAGIPAVGAAISPVVTTTSWNTTTSKWNTTTTTWNTTTSSLTTLPPSSFLRSVESGWYHTCAVRYDGTVACWGAGSNGQLGTGGLTPQTTAVTIPGLHTVTELAAGTHHTCALTSSREVWCWGRNDRGQLGDGTLTRRTTPVKVALPGVTLLAVGDNHACAATGSLLYCWGANESGQLGTNDTTDRSKPTLVALAPSDFVALGAFNASTCGQSRTGLTACTGSNLGVFGNGTAAGSTLFTTVPSLTANGANTVISGSIHRCHVETVTGSVRCVGGNRSGGLGDGTKLDRTTFVSPSGTYSTVAAGSSNTSCGFEQIARRYRCWGSNSSGQVGDGTTTDRLTPVAVKGLSSTTQTSGSVSVGRNHACATLHFGGGTPDRVYCWGSDTNGQLGNGAGGSSSTAVRVQGI